MRLAPLVFRRSVLDWSRPYLMGVLNVTPDSFSDGGRFGSPADAVEAGVRMAAAGADLLDVGGESTRPVGARPVDAAEEIERILPVVRGLVGRVAVPISIDTSKAAVAQAAVEAGAEVVNDVSGGRFDPALVGVVERSGAVLVCGHARGGSIAEMHAAEAAPPGYAEVADELGERLAALPLSVRLRAIVDPGLGFGKRTAQNLELLRRAGELAATTGRPVLVGPSRKRFLGELTGRDVDARDDATVGAALAAFACGAHVVRVHDVARTRDALTIFSAVLGAQP